MEDSGEKMMKQEERKRGYFNIALAAIIIVTLGIVFARLFYISSQDKILNTLGEISEQEVQVLCKEIEKGKQTLSNLAVYIGQDESLDMGVVLQRLMAVDDVNGFKRMGIIRSDGQAYTTDAKVMYLGDREYFKISMDGEEAVSDTLIDVEGGGKINVYSAPVTFQDGSRCVLFATYEMVFFENTISTTTFKGTGHSYVVKKDGEHIAGQSEEDGFGDFENLFEMLRSSEKNQAAVSQMKTDMGNGASGSVTITLGSKSYIYYQPLDINGWYLLNVVPVSVVDRDINGSLVLTYLFAFICIIALIILLLNIGRERRRSREAIEKAAFVDPVTGGNTFAKFKLDAQSVLRTDRGGSYVMAVLNILKFQYINDLFGYEEGNRALRYIAGVILRNLTEEENFGRKEGDHFIILMKYESDEAVQKRMEEMIEDVCGFARQEKKPYEIKMLAGVYKIEERMIPVDTMADRAEMALTRDDRKPFECCTFYDDTIRNKKIREKEIEDSFEEALRAGEFVVYYQPKYDIRKDRFFGAEALIRWRTSDGSLVAPDAFIGIYEGNGMIVRLDQYVFERVCLQIRKWLDLGYEVTPVSINVSKVHLYRTDFVESYLEIISRYKVPVELIQLELTETVLFDNEKILKKILEEFRRAGIQILMDDFGSGYTSIGMLKDMPIDEIKLDKSLVDDYGQSVRVQKILKSIISLSHELGLEVVAEGVEIKQEYDYLAKIGCDYIQGYYCSRPLPVDSYTKLVYSDKQNVLLGTE